MTVQPSALTGGDLPAGLLAALPAGTDPELVALVAAWVRDDIRRRLLGDLALTDAEQAEMPGCGEDCCHADTILGMQEYAARLAAEWPATTNEQEDPR
ncbi:hypothetical protein ACFY05_32900 [Microtetraspora fusca]|uniref:Uncharacterized protein n=1 Tax=Microtetraspora fusca TaxID=1997 RepID=A0ABW6VHN7_MICFU